MPNRHEIYNPRTDKTVKVKCLYGNTAKQCYRSFIEDLGWDPEMVLSDGLSYQNGRFNFHQLPLTSES
eukprot:SAG31_NODE_35648_length_321_cov_0.693694_1_plen_67_part_01